MVSDRLFWVERKDFTTLTKSKICPLCYGNFDTENKKICPNCKYQISEEGLKYILKIIKKKIGYKNQIKIMPKKIPGIAEVYYKDKLNHQLKLNYLNQKSTDTIHNFKKKMDSISHDLFPIININKDLLFRTNEMHIGAYNLSFWFCIILHEVAHIIDAYENISKNNKKIQEDIKAYYKRYKYRHLGEERVKRYVWKFLENKLTFEEALEVKKGYETVTDRLKLKEIKILNYKERCTVPNCDLPSKYKCTWCGRKLCEIHIIEDKHYPCIQKKLYNQAIFRENLHIPIKKGNTQILVPLK